MCTHYCPYCMLYGNTGVLILRWGYDIYDTSPLGWSIHLASYFFHSDRNTIPFPLPSVPRSIPPSQQQADLTSRNITLLCTPSRSCARVGSISGPRDASTRLQLARPTRQRVHPSSHTASARTLVSSESPPNGSASPPFLHD